MNHSGMWPPVLESGLDFPSHGEPYWMCDGVVRAGGDIDNTVTPIIVSDNPVELPVRSTVASDVIIPISKGEPVSLVSWSRNNGCVPDVAESVIRWRPYLDIPQRRTIARSNRISPRRASYKQDFAVFPVPKLDDRRMLHRLALCLDLLL